MAGLDRQHSMSESVSEMSSGSYFGAAFAPKVSEVGFAWRRALHPLSVVHALQSQKWCRRWRSVQACKRSSYQPGQTVSCASSAVNVLVEVQVGKQLLLNDDVVL